MCNTDDLEQKILDKILKLGYQLEYVEDLIEQEMQIIKVVIDNKKKISTSDCEKVSKAIEDIVDKNVNYPNGYILEVSSPGLERALKNIKLFKKYIGEKVLIKLHKRLNENEEIIGTLKKVTDEIIVLDVSKNEIEIKYSDIAHANTIYDFKEEM